MRAVVACLFLATGVARAEPDDITARPLVLRADQFEAVLTTEIDLAARQVARPLSFAPDVWLGITPHWTVGITHSNASVSRIERASSFCFRHTSIGCNRTYTNVGVDVRRSLRAGVVSVAARGRFLVRDVDPFKPALTAGALVRWQRGRLSITGDPYLRIGLANTGEGNRTALFLPIVAMAQPIPRVAFAVHTGYDADLAVWHDGWHIPLGFSARGRVTHELEAGMLLGFASALGPQDTLNRRTLWFWIALRGG